MDLGILRECAVFKITEDKLKTGFLLSVMKQQAVVARPAGHRPWQPAFRRRPLQFPATLSRYWNFVIDTSECSSYRVARSGALRSRSGR